MSSDKTMLIVIYNHNYEKNISKIRRIYSSRFSKIVQIMPFYRGDDPDVIGVYDASWQFNGYITQAWPRIKAMGSFSHYLVIADDIILNPELDEGNIIEKMQLPQGAAYIHSANPITRETFIKWKWAYSSYAQILLKGNHCEFRRFIPSIEEARRKFEKHGLDWRSVVPKRFVDTFIVPDFSGSDIMGHDFPSSKRGTMSFILKKLIFFFTSVAFHIRHPFTKVFCADEEYRTQLLRFAKIFTKRHKEGEEMYPLAWGYSDTLIIPSAKMDDFTHLCGVFSAMRLFVEIVWRLEKN